MTKISYKNYSNFLFDLKLKEFGLPFVSNSKGKFQILFGTILMLFFVNLSYGQSGTVFRDFNGDGVKSTNEPLMPGVIVNAYNTSNVLCGTATTSGSTAPNYSITGCSGSVRVEFILPSSGVCVENGIDFSSFVGSSNGTSVQFGTDASTNINFALHSPEDYTPTDSIPVLRAFMPCYLAGDPLVAGQARSADWFVGYLYTSSGTATPPPLHVGGDLGSTYGVAYSEQARKVFTSAFLKRHVGLGIQGSGGIYMLTPDPANSTFIVNNFYDLDANTHRTRAGGTAPAYGGGAGQSYTLTGGNTVTYNGAPDVLTGKPSGLGVIGTNGQRGLTSDPTDPSFDPAAFDQIGKVGLGDLEISEDGKYLFVVNLYSRKVFRLELNDAANPTSVVAVTSYDVPLTMCNDGESRPFALKYARGNLYVGSVCTGENGGTAADLSASVHVLNDAIGGTPTWGASPIINAIPLNYARQGSADYEPWNNNSSNQNEGAILSDIEFSDNGDLILAFLDRGGHQFGSPNNGNLSGGNNTVNYSSEGEILMAGLNCTTGQYTIENNASVMSINGTTLSGLAHTNDEGPGGREFFNDNAPNASGGGTDPHFEIVVGGIAVVKGQGSVMVNNYAAFNNQGSDAGTLSFSTTDGSYVPGSAYMVYNSSSDNNVAKAAGFGDLEVSGILSPIQIGNRVWVDTDNDGIQDAGEVAIAGVVVQLLDDSGTVIATDTTDADGNYYFSSGPGTNTSSAKYNISSLQPNMDYTVRIPNVIGGSKQTALGLNSLTLANNDATANGDARDSDGTLVGNNADVSLTTGVEGANNHSFDFGFGQIMCITPSAVFTPLASTCLPNGSPGDNGTIQLTSQTSGTHYGVSTLNAASYDGPTTIAGATAIPGSLPSTIVLNVPHTGGTYRIRIFNGDAACFADSIVVVPAGLPCCITPSAVFTPTASTCLTNGTPGNNGTIQLTSQTSGTHYGVSTLNAASYDGPTTIAGATAIPGSLPSTIVLNVPHAGGTYRIRIFNVTDACFTDSVVVVPAGEFCYVSVGSTVFVDLDDDGVKETGEAGIAGVTVNLYTSAGMLVESTMTNGSGNYLFDSLLQGDYYIQVVFTDTLGRASTPDDNGDTDATLQNGDQVLPGVIQSNTFTLTANTEPVEPAGGEDATGDGQDNTDDNNGNMTIDFGIVPLMSVGSTVFVDNNDNGIKDATDAGIAGITVNLYNSANVLQQTVMTDGSGNYFFDSLLAGDYYVEITFNDTLGRASTPDENGDIDDDLQNGDQQGPGVIRSNTFTLAPNTEPTGAGEAGSNDTTGDNQDNSDDNNGNMTIDFGIVPLMSVGSTVFVDNNDNGIKDATDAGIAGVTVNLYNSANVLQQTVMTDASGNYLFDSLVQGDYYVQIVFTDTLGRASNPDDNTDTDASLQNGDQVSPGVITSNTFTLTANTEPTGAGEAGSNDGTGDAQDNTDDNNGNMTIDFGIVPLVEVGSTVFVDLDDDGVKEAGEAGISGVTVQLYTSTGTLVETVMTDASGNYLFDSLLQGDYYIRVVFTDTLGRASNPDDNTDTDASLQNGDQLSPGVIQSNTFTLTANTEPVEPSGGEDATGDGQDNNDDNNGNMTIDFGIVPLMSVGSTVFVDNNDNGIKDATDAGIAGIIVNLYNSANVLQQTVMTDASGNYLFDSLLAGDYYVEISFNDTLGRASTPDENGDIDDDLQNGDQQGPGVIRSNTFTLAPNTEPTGAGEAGSNDATGDAQDNTDDNNGNMTIDFGIVPLVEVGSTVFVDNNDNGIKDATDAGIAGVTVNLYNSANVLQQTVMTDASGNYLFDSLLQGDYYVQIVFTDTLGRASNPDDNTDTDASLQNGDQVSPGLIQSNTFTLTANTEPTGAGEAGSNDGTGDAQDNTDDNNGNMTIDFGIVPLVEVGSTVFVDLDDDGVKEAGEAGISGVTVQLYTSTGTLVETVMTDASGNYLFDSLLQGDYYIRVVFTDTLGRASNPDDNTDTDASLQNGDQLSPGVIQSNTFTLTANTEPVEPAGGEDATGDGQDNNDDNNGNMTIDFGIVPLMSVGSTVFVDNNDNGIKNATDNGISGITVTLYNAANMVIGTTMTDGSGNYFFDSLLAGDYYVEISFNDTLGRASTPDENGDIDDDLQNGDQQSPGVIRSNTFTLAPNTEPAGAGEAGSNDTTGDNQDNSDDNNGNMTIDFGIVPLVEVGSTVFVDNNDNGIKDATDAGIAGVTVNLYNSANVLQQTVMTDASGNYLFDSLLQGDYYVQIVFTDTLGRASNPDDNTDTDASLQNGDQVSPGLIQSNTFTLTANTEPTGAGEAGSNDGTGDAQDNTDDNNGNMTIDFGIVPLVEVGSTVFVDLDDDGVKEGGEAGIAGVTVNLYTSAGVLVEMTTTDGSGNYLFDSLLQGDYYIQVVFTDTLGRASNPDDNGDTDAALQNGDQVSPGVIQSNTFTLTANTEPVEPAGGEDATGDGQDNNDDNNGNMTIDFGIVPLMSVGSTVFIDNNDNGIKDATDAGIAGITVNLYNSANVLQQTVMTDASGNYLFDSLLAGDYFVEIVFADTLGRASNPDDNTDTDASLQNGDQVSAGVIRSNTFTLAPNTEPTGAGEAGSNDATGDAQDNTDDNNGNMTIDFGIVPLMSVGSTVFVDNNDNGIKDAGDNGIAGITVNLYNTANMLVQSTMTDGSGNYLFDSLLQGDYYVEIAFNDTLGRASTPDDNADADATLQNGDQVSAGLIRSNTFTLTADAEPVEPAGGEDATGDAQDNTDDNNGNMTIDFGIVPLVEVGSTVFVDLDDDGVKEGGEAGIAGVTVNLYTAAGTLVETTMTDGSGNYLFDSLLQGDYYVQIVFTDTLGRASTPDDNTDTDASLQNGDQVSPGVIQSNTFTLTANMEPVEPSGGEDATGDAQDNTDDNNGNMTIDFGIVPLMSVGSTVFVDNNDNGTKDATDAGIAGITVNLYNSANVLQQTVMTDASGNYLFDSLLTGDYYVEIVFGDTLGRASTPNDNTDIDANLQNGDQQGPGVIRSNTFTLAPNTEPTGAGEAGSNDATGDAQDNTDDNNGNMTIDFGIVPLYSVGNTVWNDLDYDGIKDVSEIGFANIVVELRDPISGALLQMTTTDANGNYLFDSLLAGDYIVVIPASQVNNGGPLQNYISSTGTFNSGGQYEDGSIIANSDVDNNDDGYLNRNPLFPGAVASSVVTLGGNAEPTNETDEEVGVSDNRSNLSVDFGFVQKVMDLALVKTTMKMTGYKYGDTAMFEIKVVNQGNVPAQALKVTDFAPSGFEFFVPQTAQLPSLQWMYDAITMQGMIMPNKVLLPRDTCKFEVDLIIRMSPLAGSFVNRAEITSFTDTTGIIRPDVDSKPDNIKGNDNGYLPFSDADNYLDGTAFDTIRNPDGSYTLTSNGGAPNDGVASTDEDDDDGELIEIIDLATKKVLVSAGPFKYGDEAEFKVTIYNQGSIPMKEIRMVDSMGRGLDFKEGSILIDGTTIISSTSDNKVYYTIPSSVMPGDTALIQGDSVCVTYRAFIRQAIPSTDLTAWDNQTQITQVTDFRDLTYEGDVDGDFGDTFTPEDTQPESGDDNNTSGDELNEGEDLDSKDPVRVKIYDIALRKVLKNPDTVYGSGQEVELFVTVYNQGNQSLTNIGVVDYLPPTMSLTGATNTIAWVVSGSEARYTITDTLHPGDTLRLPLNVIFDISQGKDIEDFLNFAEVFGFTDTTGLSTDDGELVDADSTPDDIKDNDGGSQYDGPSNDAIDGDGTGTVFQGGTAGNDEDDNDVVFVIPCQQLACYDEVNVSLDGECEIEITPSVTFNAVYTGKPYYVIVKDLRGNIIPGNIVNRSHVGQRLIVEVHEPEFCGNNSCWGYINIEDKLGPKLDAPKDTCVYCIESTLPTRTGQATATDCGSTPKVEYRDVVVDFACKKDGDTIQIITRTWFATDDKGNTTISVQKIYVKALSSDSIRAPRPLVTVACGTNITPEALAANSSFGITYAYPHYISPVTGLPVAITRGSSCHFAADYVDKPILEEVCKANCKSTQKILRTWTVLNWCTGKAEKYLQVIKLEDKIAPTIRVTSPSEIYSVNAWGCDVDITMPTATVRDACDEDATVVSIQGPVGVSVVKRGNTWVALNVPSGTHTFTYYASDCCGNESTATITLTVVDRVAPVATAKEFITVSLVRSGADDILGVAKLFVDQVDNGSYDNCTKVYREIRREDDAPACLNTGGVMANGQLYNNNRTYNSTINGLDQSTSLHLQDNTLDTDKGQFVKFCCDDIGKEVKVWLRVWDDANGSGIYGDVVDGLSDNYNETWSIVKVEDKTVPRITCKPDVTIDCARDTGAVTEYNFSRTWISTVGKVPAGMLPGVEGACGVYEFEFRDAGSLNTCNVGTFTREYRVKDHPSVVCTMRIVVDNTTSSPVLEWPIDLHEWSSCTLTEADVYENTVRAVIADQLNGCGVTGTNQWMCAGLTGTELANCRRAQATNGFTPNSGPLGSSLRDRVRFNSNYKNIGCNVFGKKLTIEEYAVGEGCKKWVVRWDYINWCDNSNAGCRTTIYKYEDTTAPVITSCPGADEDIEDATCTFPIVLRPSATDAGGCDAALTWRARIYEGTNIGINPSGAVLRTATGVGTNPTISFTGANSLPAGTYTVRYFVTDGCGNVSECDATIGIWPKAATPYCVSLSSAVMKNGLVELWARDFDRGSFTNCGSGVMYFTFNRGGVAEHPNLAQLDRQHYFTGFGTFLAFKTDAGNATGEAAARALYNEGKAQLWLPDVTVRPRPTLPNGTAQPDERIVTGGTSGMNFGCKAGNTIGVPITVEMRVWDRRSFKEGTTQGSDFCSTRLTLIDNQGGCGANTLVTLGGTVQTESVEMMNAVDVSLKAELPEYPQATKTDKDGKYTFSNLPIGVNYTIEAKKGDDYINGVNTLDLVQIQRHILGIKKLDNPYKLIAADADGDKAIRVNDIVTLRKMILGITDKIEEMPSWRFVDASDKMENGPWPFREAISHGALTETTTKNNFIGVKIGDVDGTASANAVTTSTQPRSTGVRLSVEDRAMKAGEEVEVSLAAEQFNEVHGMQLTLSHVGMELVSIDGRAIEMTVDHVGKVSKDKTTMSWASANGTTVSQGSEVMRMRFRATKALQISNALSITSEVTGAEAYIGADMERSGIVLEVRGKEGRPFAVGQNEPNPWKASTMIKYELPAAGAVKLTVMDVTGKVIRKYDTKGVAGVNEVRMTREELNGATGVLIYKVESGAFSAQKKMLVIE